MSFLERSPITADCTEALASPIFGTNTDPLVAVLLTRGGGTTEYVMEPKQALEFAAAIITARSVALANGKPKEEAKPPEPPPEPDFTVIPKFIRRDFHSHVLYRGHARLWDWTVELEPNINRMGISLACGNTPALMLLMTKEGAKRLADQIANYMNNRSAEVALIPLGDDLAFRMARPGWSTTKVDVRVIVGSQAINRRVEMPVFCLSLIAQYLEAFANDERLL